MGSKRKMNRKLEIAESIKTVDTHTDSLENIRKRN